MIPAHSIELTAYGVNQQALFDDILDRAMQFWPDAVRDELLVMMYTPRPFVASMMFPEGQTMWEADVTVKRVT